MRTLTLFLYGRVDLALTPLMLETKTTKFNNRYGRDLAPLTAIFLTPI